MGTKDATLARLIRIIAQYFTPRRRSRNGRNSAGTTDDDYPEGGDGEDASGSDEDEKPDSSLAEASGLEATTCDGVGAEGSESCECPDIDDDDAFEHERLAYFLGGTPRPTPTKGSPWSPGIEVKPEDSGPHLNTADGVKEAIQKIESLDQNHEIHIQFVSSK